MKSFFARFARHRAALLGLLILVAILFLAVVGPFVYPRNAFELVGQPFNEPFGEYLLGTDMLDRMTIGPGLFVGQACRPYDCERRSSKSATALGGPSPYTWRRSTVRLQFLA